MLDAKGQLAYLKFEINTVAIGTKEAGSKAKFIREQLKPCMKLDELFYSDKGDEKFMHEELRKFLNLNKDGYDYYLPGDMDKKDGWFQIIPFLGDNEHQENQSGGRNVKYCNLDGREAIFDAKNVYMYCGHDAASYNYGKVRNCDIGSISPNGSHGKYDMKPFYRQQGGGQPFFWSKNDIGTGYASNVKDW